MKHITAFILMLVFLPIFADQLPKERDEQIEEMAKEGYNLIDAIFTQAHLAIQAREDFMDENWWSKQKELKKLQNLLSDATIIFTFDAQSENPIPQKLATYVEHKINEEVPFIFAIDKISVEQVKDFYEFSHIMCKLSGGKRCAKMMHNIQDDHFDKMLKLKLQKMVLKQAKKEQARELRDALVFGGHR
jgi:hypothetical protein